MRPRNSKIIPGGLVTLKLPAAAPDKVASVIYLETAN
jgi:hypothetical protein